MSTRAAVGLAWSVIALVAAGSPGCAPITAENSVTARLDEYFREHREVSPEVAAAMQRGHIAAGMNQQQVTAVLGKPLRAVRHAVQPWLQRGEIVRPMSMFGFQGCERPTDEREGPLAVEDQFRRRFPRAH